MIACVNQQILQCRFSLIQVELQKYQIWTGCDENSETLNARNQRDLLKHWGDMRFDHRNPNTGES